MQRPSYQQLDQKSHRRDFSIRDVAVAYVVSDHWKTQHEQSCAPLSDRTLYSRFISDIRRIARGLLNLVHKDNMDGLFAIFTMNNDKLNRAQFVNLFLQLSIKESGSFSRLSNNKDVPLLELVCALSELFDKADINGDGTISIEELLGVVLGYRDSGSTVNLDDAFFYKKRPPIMVFHRKGFDKIATVIASNAMAVKEIGSNAISFITITNGSANVRRWNCEVPSASNVMTYVGESKLGTKYNLLVFGVGQCLLTFPLEAEGVCLERAFTSRSITAFLYSPDEDLLFIGFDDGDISTWRLASYNKYTHPEPRSDQSILKFKGHSAAISGMGYTHDGRLLFSCSMDSSVRLWDVLTGNALRCYNHGHQHGIVGIVMASKTRLLLSAGLDSSICVWNLYSEKVLFKIKGHGAALAGIGVLKSSQNIVTADIHGVVKIWDNNSFLCLQTITLRTPLSSLCIANDSIVGFHEGGDMVLIESASPELSTRAHMYQMVLYNDLDFTLIAAAQNSLQVWNLLTGKLDVESVVAPSSDIATMCFDSLKKRIAAGTCDGQIIILNAATLTCLQKHAKTSGEILSICWTSNPSRIATITRTEIRVLNQENDSIIYREMLSSTVKIGLSSRNAEQESISWADASSIAIFNINRCTTTPIKSKAQDVSTVCFCNDTDLAVISTSKALTCVVKIDNGGWFSMLGYLRTDGDLTAITFSSALQCIFAGYSSGALARFDIKSIIGSSRKSSKEAGTSNSNQLCGEQWCIVPSWKQEKDITYVARSIIIVGSPTHFALITELGRLLIFDELGAQLCEVRSDRQGLWSLHLDTSQRKEAMLAEARHILDQTDVIIQTQLLALRSSSNSMLDSAASCQVSSIHHKRRTNFENLSTDNDVLSLKIRESRSMQFPKVDGKLSFVGLKSAEMRLSSSVKRLDSRRMLHDKDAARAKPYNSNNAQRH